jgi:hypothetical protein
MATPSFRSPTSLPPDAAVLPARLAEQHDQVLWRELPGGEIEVATKTGTRVERFRVHNDGTTTPLTTSTHHSRLIKTIIFAALALGVTAVLLLVESEDKWFFTFLVLLFALSIANDWAQDLARHLRRELGAAYEWHAPTELHGWTPHTTAQLAAVEELATNHSGTAHVSEAGHGTIDVVTGVHRYVLDTNGNVVLHERNRLRSMRRDEDRAWFPITTYVTDGG